MSALFSFEQAIKALANTSMTLVCVIVVTLLTASCATVPSNQTTSTDTTANSLATNEKSEKETAADALQKLECRTVDVIGTRLKRKVCEFKETWAAIDKKNSEKSGEFKRKMDEQSTVVNPEGLPASNTSINSATTSPMGQ